MTVGSLESQVYPKAWVISCYISYIHVYYPLVTWLGTSMWQEHDLRIDVGLTSCLNWIIPKTAAAEPATGLRYFVDPLQLYTHTYDIIQFVIYQIIYYIIQYTIILYIVSITYIYIHTYIYIYIYIYTGWWFLKHDYVQHWPAYLSVVWLKHQAVIGNGYMILYGFV